MFHLHKQMSSEMKCFSFAYVYQCFLKLHRTGDVAREVRMTGSILKSTFLWHWALDLCSTGRATIAFWWGMCIIIIITNDDSWIVFQRSVMHKDYIVIGEGRTLPLPTQLECTHFWNTYSKPNTYVCTRTHRKRENHSSISLANFRVWLHKHH